MSLNFQPVKLLRGDAHRQGDKDASYATFGGEVFSTFGTFGMVLAPHAGNIVIAHLDDRGPVHFPDLRGFRVSN